MRALTTEIDERLLIEAAQRDPRHFTQLYEDNFDRVYAYIARRTRNRAEAEDLTAEVFRQALAKLKQFEWRGVPIKAWLLRIATNVLHDRWRDPARQREVTGEDWAETSVETETERRALLMQVVDRLPEDQRMVLKSRAFEGRSLVEIARDLGRSEGAIRQLQFRALQTLRRQMRSNHE